MVGGSMRHTSFHNPPPWTPAWLMQGVEAPFRSCSQGLQHGTPSKMYLASADDDAASLPPTQCHDY